MTINCNQCVAPFIQIMLDPSGRASPCAILDGLWKFNDETSVEDIWNNPQLESLRDNHKNNIRDPLCDTCWNTEDNGLQSHRERLNNSDKYDIDAVVDSMKTNTYKDGPLNIHLKNGNVCNLKCRICGSWSSSKWAQEELDYGENPVARKNLTEGGWPKKHPQFFDDIQECLADAEYFEFTGGEPFMIRDHFKILMHCVEKGYAKNIDIHYNTNGTQLPPREIFDLWRYFKRVEIAFSIDDVGEQFQYQRHPANWREVNHNLVEFKTYQTHNMEFQICTTISIFNIFSLAKISLWVAQYQPKFFYVNTCFDPDYFNIQTLPKQIKNIVNSRYSMLTDFQPTLRFMNSAHRDSEEIREQRKARILQTDKYRKENFGDVFPLLNKVLQIYE